MVSTSLHCPSSRCASCTRVCCSGTRQTSARLLLGLSALSFQSPPFFEHCSVPYTSFFFYFILQLANTYTPYTGNLYSYHMPLLPKAYSTELSHADSWLSSQCARGTQAVGVMPGDGTVRYASDLHLKHLFRVCGR